MDSESALPGTNNDPASAFEALRGEISLLRRAVEGLTAERQAAPNYKPTLAAMAERLAAIEHSRSEEHTSELQSLMRISYAVFCLKKKHKKNKQNTSENRSHN